MVKTPGAASPPRRKPEPPNAAARLRHGAATTARRARASGSRLAMTRAAQAVLAAPETPATALPGRLKAETGKVLKDGLAEAGRAGLPEEELARLEADLGAQELVLLEQGLAEQAARLQAQTEAQLESEAGELVEALRRNPARAASAEAALAELLADFGPAFRPSALDGFAAATRRRLAEAGVEGLLARGEAAAAEAALEAADDLPESTRRRLRQEIDDQRQRQPLEDQGLAEGNRARRLADLEAGRSLDPASLRQVAALEGPEALERLGEDLARAAERRRVARRLAASPPRAGPEILEGEGFDAGGLDLGRGEPAGAQDPRLAEAPQLAQAGGDDAGGAANPFRRRDGETSEDWVLRIQDGLRRSRSLEDRRPIYDAFFEGLPRDPVSLLELKQGVAPGAHRTAAPAPEHIQRDYDRLLETGQASPDGPLPDALAFFYFVGPGQRLFDRDSEAVDSPLLAMLESIQVWMAHDRVTEADESGDRRQAVQLFLEGLLEVDPQGRGLPRPRPNRILGMTAPGGGRQGDGKADAQGSGQGGGDASSGQGDAAGASQTGQPAGGRKTLRLKQEVEDPAPPGFQRKPPSEPPPPPLDITTLIEQRVITQARPARQRPEAQVHSVRGQEELVFAEQGTQFFIGPDRSIRDNAGRVIDVDTPVAAEVLQSGRPLGMSDPATFAKFKDILSDHRADLPADTRFAIRGSAITGDGFDKSKERYERGYFDSSRESDWDVAIVSPSLFERARRMGIALRQGGTRTATLGKKDLQKLGLTELFEDVRSFPGRGKTRLMIYGSQKALNSRGPNIIFKPKQRER